MGIVKLPCYQLAMSAKTPVELLDQMVHLQQFLAQNRHVPIEDIIYSVNLTHHNHPYRIALYEQTHEDLIAALQKNIMEPTFQECGHPPRIAFLCPGKQAYYPKAISQLYHSEFAFKSTIDRCAKISEQYSDLPFQDLLALDIETLQGTEHYLPVLFALELGLGNALKHYGLRPDILLGHCIGEYVAAVLAGGISLEDALRMLYHRIALYEQFHEMVQSITCSDPHTPLISSLTGQPFEIGELNPFYWAMHLTHTIAHYNGLGWLLQNHIDTFVELGHQPMPLSSPLTSSTDWPVRWKRLSHHEQEWESVLNTLVDLYLEGAAIDWALFARSNGLTRHLLPIEL